MKKLSMTHLTLAILVLVLVTSVFDIVEDIHEMDGQWSDHVSVEAFLAFLCILGLVILLKSVRRQDAHLSAALTKLHHTTQKLDEYESQTSKVMQEFSQIIQQQFSEWQLTPSEKEVALLLLKGLSLDEIAQVRETKSKTVRQQASSCYKKANVSGRHELAAFFFEDLLL